MPSVLFALPGIHRVRRGAETAMEAMAGELARLPGWEVTVMGAGEPIPGRAYKYEKVECPPFESFVGKRSLPLFRTPAQREEFVFARRMMTVAAGRRWDLTVGCSWPWVHFALRRLAGSRGRHVFWTQNGDHMLAAGRAEYRMFSCDGLVCTNPAYYARHRERWRSVLLPNGVDPEVFFPLEEKLGGGTPSLPTVLVVSALIPSKRVDAAVRAVGRLGGVKLIVCGEGPEGENLDRLGKEVLGERYERIRLPREEMPGLYRRVNAVVHPCDVEPSANVWSEALASGKVVVAHDMEVTRWVLGEHGVLVDARDDEKLAQGIARALAIRGGEEVRHQSARQRLAWSAIAREMAGFMRELLSISEESGFVGASGPKRLMYVTPAYPVLSETFVRREIEGLRAAGNDVVAVGLRKSQPSGGSGRAEASLVLYDRGFSGRLIKEIVLHPLQSVRTLLRGLGDALVPGERTTFSNRVKIVAQAAGGVVLGGEIRRRGIEHVHAHFAHAPTTVAMYAALQAGRRFSFTGHANDIFQRRVLLRTKLQRCGFVACISQWHRDFYKEVLKRGQKAAETAARGQDTQDTERWMPIVRCGVEAGGVARKRRELEGAEGMRVLVVARLVEKKGVDVLLKAMARFSGSGWELRIAGDGPERQRLELLARELKVKVEFLGAVANERISELLSWAEVFVLPCREDTAGDRDGIPVVLMESMAAGVPVISGDLPAIRELVIHGESGLMVKPGDYAALADALSALSDDDAQWECLSTGGLKRVKEEFLLEENVERLQRAFRRCVHNVRGENAAESAVLSGVMSR